MGEEAQIRKKMICSVWGSESGDCDDYGFHRLRLSGSLRRHGIWNGPSSSNHATGELPQTGGIQQQTDNKITDNRKGHNRWITETMVVRKYFAGLPMTVREVT